MPNRTLKWLVAALAAVLALPSGAVLWAAVFGWNWARGPLQEVALRQHDVEMRPPPRRLPQGCQAHDQPRQRAAVGAGRHMAVAPSGAAPCTLCA